MLYIQDIQPGDKSKGDFSLSVLLLKTIAMKKVVKQVVGIDVAQKELVCLGKLYEDFTAELYGQKHLQTLQEDLSIFDMG